MASVVVWGLLAFVLFLAATWCCVVATAIVGRAFGVEVQRVGVGYDFADQAIARWQGRHWEWVIGIIPFGGYTKFRNANDPLLPSIEVREEGILEGVRIIEDSEPLDYEEFPPNCFEAASLPGRFAIALVGPFVQALIGALMLGAAVWSAEPQLELSPPARSEITPCAVGGMSFSDQRSTWEAQFQLFCDIGGGAFSRFMLFQSRDDWGGWIGSFATAGGAAEVSLAAFLTCVGVFQCIMAAFSLLPLGVLNGGAMINAVLISVLGWRRTERMATRYAVISFLYLLLVYARVIYMDVVWLASL